MVRALSNSHQNDDFREIVKAATQFGTSQFGTLRASSERFEPARNALCSELALGVRGMNPRASSERFDFALAGRPWESQIRVRPMLFNVFAEIRKPVRNAVLNWLSGSVLNWLFHEELGRDHHKPMGK